MPWSVLEEVGYEEVSRRSTRSTEVFVAARQTPGGNCEDPSLPDATPSSPHLSPCPSLLSLPALPQSVTPCPSG